MKLLNYSRFFLIISAAISVVAIIALAVFGLRLGIDFKGGTATELKFNSAVNLDTVRMVLEEQQLAGSQVTPTDNNGVIIRTAVIDKNKHDALLKDLKEKAGEFEEKRFDSIGPVVGEQLARKALYQLILVSFGIVFYIAYAFRKVSRPVTAWQFGISAIVALLHDLIVVLGVFAILGKFFEVEIDSLFITAMLTVLGFSVHDTIIVFDRIRENLKVYAGQSMTFIINHSISQTLVRSLNTSLTVLFVLLALLLFGGDTIRYFVLALFIGIAVGTYSSIFVASPVLLALQNWRSKKS